MSSNGTFISPSVYKAKTSAIQGGGTALNLDNSAFSSEGEVCKTDVMEHLAEIEHQAYDLIGQHKIHVSSDLPTFLSALAQSIADTATGVSASLNEDGNK